MKLSTRLSRTAKVVWAGARLWGMYEVPAHARRALGRPEPTDRALAATHARAAQTLLALALDLGGVTIKMCQAIGTRSDIFPPEMVASLKQCHDAVPPQPFEVVRATIERELGRPLGAIFAELEPTALASASLAQVHRGRLLDGREVAVKVQYPDIAERVAIDLANLRRACKVYERFDGRPLELSPLLEELAKHLALELDFTREARSAARVRELFADDPGVFVPAVHRGAVDPARARHGARDGHQGRRESGARGRAGFRRPT